MIDSQLEDMIHCTEKWARINSHSYNLEGLNTLSQELLSAFSPFVDSAESLPLDPIETFDEKGDIQIVPLGPLLSFKKSGKRPILLAGHMDTVYPVDHPFKHVVTTKDRIHGPGVADMKGGLAILLTLVRALKDHERGFEVVITPDEEIGSPRSSAYFEKIAPQFEAALLFEPALADGSLVSSRMGSANYLVVCQGVAAHMGRDPHHGRSAIVALSDLTLQLTQLQNFAANRLVNVGTIRGGHAANVVPDRCQISVNIRTQNSDDLHLLENEMKRLAREIEKRHQVTIAFDRLSFRPPKPEQRSLMESFLQLARQMEMPLTFKPTGGSCDGNNLFSYGLPNLDSLGPIGHHLHSPQEYLEISSFIPHAKLAYLYCTS